MKKYDLLKDEPFEAAEVPAPVELKSAEDYAQLTQHLVSVYRLQLNLVYRHAAAAAHDDGPALKRHHARAVSGLYQVLPGEPEGNLRPGG